MFFIFTIDKEGKLIKYEIKVTSAKKYNKIENVDLTKLMAEDFEFIPASVNGNNVASILVFEELLHVKHRM